MATKFRQAIEVCGPDTLDFCFRESPHDACGDVAPLLGTFVIENGLGSFGYVSGKRGEVGPINTWETHAWLQQGELTVYITAGQFPEVSDKVVVADDSQWHRTFTTTIKRVADYRVFDEEARVRLDLIYRRILWAPATS